MTDFSTQMVCGNVVGSLVGSDKGDISNRVSCAGAQLKNNVQTLAADTVVIGGGAGALYAAKKLPKFQQFLVKCFNKGAKYISPNMATLKKFVKLPGMAKAAALVALPVTIALSYLGNKQVYKSGQIDQKYTDKAKIEAKGKDVI